MLHILRNELSRERLEERAYLHSAAQQALIDVGVDVLMSCFSGRSLAPTNNTEPAPPFRKVLVAIGPEGVPDGLRVINVPGLARGGGTP